MEWEWVRGAQSLFSATFSYRTFLLLVFAIKRKKRTECSVFERESETGALNIILRLPPIWWRKNWIRLGWIPIGGWRKRILLDSCRRQSNLLNLQVRSHRIRFPICGRPIDRKRITSVWLTWWWNVNPTTREEQNFQLRGGGGVRRQDIINRLIFLYFWLVLRRSFLNLYRVECGHRDENRTENKRGWHDMVTKSRRLLLIWPYGKGNGYKKLIAHLITDRQTPWSSTLVILGRYSEHSMSDHQELQQHQPSRRW